MPAPFYKAQHQRGNVRPVYRQGNPLALAQRLPFDVFTQAVKHRFWTMHYSPPTIATLQQSSLHNENTVYQPVDHSAMNCLDNNGSWRVCGWNGGLPELGNPRVNQGGPQVIFSQPMQGPPDYGQEINARNIRSRG